MVKKVGIGLNPVVRCPRGDLMPLRYCRVVCPFFKGVDEQGELGVRCAWRERHGGV